MEQLDGDSHGNLKIFLNFEQILYGYSHIIIKLDSMLVALEQCENLAQLCLSNSHPCILCTEEISVTHMTSESK